MNLVEWIIAFDFDGVLVDPLDEVVLSASETYNELNETNFDLNFFREKFRNSTHLIRTGKDVMPMMRLIAEGKDTTKMKRKELNELKKKIGQKRVLELEEEYYARKRRLRQETEKWLECMKPHKKAIEAFKQVSKKLDTWIVSTRDSESILLFLESQGHSMSPEKIIDKTVSHDKDRQFELLAEKTRMPFERMAFFEDTIFNSMVVKKLGVHVFLSTWGFSRKEQWKKAEKEGIKPITQGEIIPSLVETTGVQF